MEKAVQRLQGFELAHFFGVRHLSPASAFHLLRFLDTLQPDCLLIEGPSDGNALMEALSDRRIKPPFALLSYTTESPVRTALYPFAEYSPEFQGILWAHRHQVPSIFIDLPTSATLRLNAQYPVSAHDFYARAYQFAGDYNYESFWERHFEHCPHTDDFIHAMAQLSETLRLMAPDEADAYNKVREAYMKRGIADALRQGYTRVAVVTGAYHTGGLLSDAVLPMTDEEVAALPQENVKLTLMPYSYYRLSSQSGYGAGNKAPEYFKLLWRCLCEGNLATAAPTYLSSLSEITRSMGHYNSTANVIEGVRLAQGLAYLHDSRYPTLDDLHDSAVCLLGAGELSAVAEAFARADVGTDIGFLPEGLSQTPIQDDMRRNLKRLKLEKYKTVVAQDIWLDLRENRRVKSEEAAFLDLHRSVFFCRLRLLGIQFAVRQGGEHSAWNEKWVLCWTPESEIQLVEAVLKGETVENAAAYAIKAQLDKADSILAVGRIIEAAYECHLMAEMPNALSRLQALCVDAGSFTEIAETCFHLANILDFKTVRNVDTDLLPPILTQLFLRGSLVLFSCAGCDNRVADEIITALDRLHQVSQRQYEYINDEIWTDSLKQVAFTDHRNPKVSGAVVALLLARGLITDDEFAVEISRRLSPGVPGDIAALWFEGLASRNRYALLSQANIWRQLDEYLTRLDADEFKRSLVFLRRTFGSFTAKEKSGIIAILADIWQVDDASAAEFLQASLSETESAQLDALNDFDFGDF